VACLRGGRRRADHPRALLRGRAVLTLSLCIVRLASQRRGTGEFLEGPDRRLILFSALLALAICVGCTHTAHVRYEVPLESVKSRTCADDCRVRYPARSVAYAECLRSCPGAREREDARCATVNRRRIACAERRFEESGLSPVAAIVGSTIVVNLLTLVVLLQ